ncbi:hypothetical protein [Streptomyces sp. NPDC056723]|uniref:hypothetical protein n=1 Tax=Streptomyces sp. NPDC056723 TaxID=3345925 RepID=UPI0036D0B642
MSEAAAAYARKLEELFSASAPSTRKELAEFVPCSPSVVTRYFNGERVAPQEFVTKFLCFLEAQGVAVHGDDRAELDALRRAAQEASGGYSAQAALSQERIAELEQELAELTERINQHDESSLIDESLDHVAAVVDEEYEHAESAATADSSGTASDLNAQLAQEITALREKVDELRHLRTEDILGGLVTGRAVAAAMGSAEASAQPRSPQLPLMDRYPFLYYVAVSALLILVTAFGSAWGELVIKANEHDPLGVKYINWPLGPFLIIGLLWQIPKLQHRYLKKYPKGHMRPLALRVLDPKRPLMGWVWLSLFWGYVCAPLQPTWPFIGALVTGVVWRWFCRGYAEAKAGPLPEQS